LPSIKDIDNFEKDKSIFKELIDALITKKKIHQLAGLITL